MSDSELLVIDNNLPFEKRQQQALLGHLVENDKFFLQARHHIKPGVFLQPYDNKVWEAKCRFYETYSRVPSTQELLGEDKALLMPEDERVVYQKHILQCQIAKNEFGLDYLTKQLTGWLKAQLFQDAFNKAQKVYNRRDLPDAIALMKDMARKIDKVSFEQDSEETFENYVDFFEKQKVELDSALTFGLPLFDKLLLPMAKQGSLLRGDTTVLLAPTNVGKTTTMITVAVHNIRARKRVLLITHEGRPEDIKEKVWCALLNVTKAQLYSMYKTPEGRVEMDKMVHYMRRYLVFLPLNQPGLNVEDVEPSIRRKQEQMQAKNSEGKGFDIIIDDYPAKLGSVLAKGGQYARRNIDDLVYNYFVQIGLEFKCHMLLAIQTNREGSKINRGTKGHEDRLLTMEDVMESWGPMTAATNVITINRDAMAKAKNRVTFYIAKSRSSETDIAVVCGSAYDRCRTHSPLLGGIWYRGTSTMKDNVDALLSQMAKPQKDGEQYDDEYYGRMQIPDDIVAKCK